MASACGLAGCAPGWYQASADREVARIVEQRKEQTLEVQAADRSQDSAQTLPATRAYEKIPVTKIAAIGAKPAGETEGGVDSGTAGTVGAAAGG